MHSDWLFQLKQCDARYQFMHCDWWISIHFPFHSLLVWKGVVRSLSVSSVLKVILCLFWQALKFLFLHSYLYLSRFLKTGPLKSCSLRVWCEWLFYFSFKNSPTLQSWQYKNNRLQSLPSFFFFSPLQKYSEPSLDHKTRHSASFHEEQDLIKFEMATFSKIQVHKKY